MNPTSHDTSSRHRRFASARFRALVAALVLLIPLSTLVVAPQVTAQETNRDFSPASGHAQVIAQGVVALPQGDAVWRTVRIRAPLLADAPFEERPLGFVFAASGPLLLVDRATGEQVRLGIGEAALVAAGTAQQRSSLAEQPVSYLTIELVPADAAPPPAGATVLQPGQPFPVPAGWHDLDLLRDTLAAGETYTLPDSGAKNVILITDGAANVARPGGSPVVLIAGEAASFSGALDVAVASADSGGEERVSFLIAVIGPELPPPAVAAETPAPAPTAPAPTAPAPPAASPAASGTGSIALQVFACPPGMTAATLAAAACAPAGGDFEVSLSSEGRAAPLTLADATSAGDSFTWSGLPYGDYLLAQTVLPAGATSYVVAARGASGNSETGYRLTLDPAQPDVSVRIYNFTTA